jgi:hypothetical protein
MSSLTRVAAAGLLVAVSFVVAHPAGPIEQTKFPGAPFSVISVSDAGFPVNAKGVEMHLLEFSPNERVWLPEEATWALKHARIAFMDVTFHQDASQSS